MLVVSLKLLLIYSFLRYQFLIAQRENVSYVFSGFGFGSVEPNLTDTSLLQTVHSVPEKPEFIRSLPFKFRHSALLCHFGVCTKDVLLLVFEKEVKTKLKSKVAKTILLTTAVILSMFPAMVFYILAEFFPSTHSVVSFRLWEAQIMLYSLANPMLYCC